MVKEAVTTVPSSSTPMDARVKAVNLSIRPLPIKRKGQDLFQNGVVEVEVFMIDRLFHVTHDAWGHETTTSDVSKTLLRRFTGSPKVHVNAGDEIEWKEEICMGDDAQTTVKIIGGAMTGSCQSDMLRLSFSAVVQDALEQHSTIVVPRKVIKWHRQLQARARIVTPARDTSNCESGRWLGALSKTRKVLQHAASTFFYEQAWFYSPSTTSSFTRRSHHQTAPIVRARVYIAPPPCYTHESSPPSYDDTVAG
jgi:hypothetical protein